MNDLERKKTIEELERRLESIPFLEDYVPILNFKLQYADRTMPMTVMGINRLEQITDVARDLLKIPPEAEPLCFVMPNGEEHRDLNKTFDDIKLKDGDVLTIKFRKPEGA